MQGIFRKSKIGVNPGSYNEKEKSVLLSLIVDIIFWIPDIAAAVLSGSITLFADVVKCGNEIISTFLSYITLRKLNRSNKEVYNYGLGKFETISCTVTGGVMFISLALVFFVALYRIAVPESLIREGTMFGIVLMILGVCTNSWLSYKNHRIAKKEPSLIMESQWRLFRTKAFSDGAVLVALTASLALAEYEWSHYIDPLASFMIVGVLFLSGYREIKTALPDLLDKTLEEELQIEIMKNLAEFFDEYHDIHGIRSRRSGSHVYIDLFLEFDPGKSMGEVQGIINRMKASLEGHIPGSSVSIMPSNGP